LVIFLQKLKEEAKKYSGLLSPKDKQKRDANLFYSLSNQHNIPNPPKYYTFSRNYTFMAPSQMGIS